jgi:hypothetical protein
MKVEMLLAFTDSMVMYLCLGDDLAELFLSFEITQMNVLRNTKTPKSGNGAVQFLIIFHWQLYVSNK